MPTAAWLIVLEKKPYFRQLREGVCMIVKKCSTLAAIGTYKFPSSIRMRVTCCKPENQNQECLSQPLPTNFV